MKRIALGADHHGYLLKEFLKLQHRIHDHQIQWLDVGTETTTRTDYPQFAFKVVKKLLSHEVDGGVLLCGTGVGMSMAANRFKHVYAALVWNAEVAKRACQEDNANILVLPADYINEQQALTIVTSWLLSTFVGEHYQKRLREIDMF
jgi:ribose 5-phosphate isomerase B